MVSAFAAVRFEQLGTDLLFQALDLLAYGRLSLVQPFCGTKKPSASTTATNVRNSSVERLGSPLIRNYN